MELFLYTTFVLLFCFFCLFQFCPFPPFGVSPCVPLFQKHLELSGYFCYLPCLPVTSCHSFACFTHFLLLSHLLLSLFISLIGLPPDSQLSLSHYPPLHPVCYMCRVILNEGVNPSLTFRTCVLPSPIFHTSPPPVLPRLSHSPQKSFHSDKMLFKRRLLSPSMASHYVVQKRMPALCARVPCDKCVTPGKKINKA